MASIYLGTVGADKIIKLLFIPQSTFDYDDQTRLDIQEGSVYLL